MKQLPNDNVVAFQHTDRRSRRVTMLAAEIVRRSRLLEETHADFHGELEAARREFSEEIEGLRAEVAALRLELRRLRIEARDIDTKPSSRQVN